MDAFEFLKKYCPVGNGDLILLYAFKNNWMTTAPEVAKRIKIRPDHARRILNTMKATGFCTRIKVDNKRAMVYRFNGKGKSSVKRIFNKKIMPYVNLTPEEFLRVEEIDIVLTFK